MTDRDSLQPGLDALATVEAAAVTLLGMARQRGLEGELDVGEDAVVILRAAQCQDEQHYHALLAAGGQPVVDAFTIPEDMVTDRTLLLVTFLELKSIGVAGYMTLTRIWAERGDYSQVEVAYQMGTVEAQHLSLAHALVGVSPANDRAFARWLFAEPAEAIDALNALDLLEGSADPVPFPGPIDRICRGVFGLTPETTATMTLPRPPVGQPTLAATPQASASDP
ncbi:MAG TPA: hypothetical protein VK356_12010 [Thermomicrobiales bacterium]|nr:hypothetical protein [Thermomicrobiales bacterium]